MKTFTRSALALLLGAPALVAGPATASTMPRPELRPGQLSVAVGVFDASADVGVTDRLQLGATSAMFTVLAAGVTGWGGRATYRIWDAPAVGTFALNAAGGISETYGGFAAVPPNYWAYGGLVYYRALSSILTLRLSLGLNAIRSTADAGTWSLGGPAGFPGVVPGAELALRITPTQELTLGGNSLIGWRGTFF